MARPSKRLFVVLSLCLLLQQFSPALTAGLSYKRLNRHEKKRHEKKHECQDEDDHDHQEIRDNGLAVRSLFGTFVSKVGTGLKRGWKLLGSKNVISKINILAEGTAALTAIASISTTVAKAIEGCKGIAPGIKTNWEESERLRTQFDGLSKTIDQINLQAQSRRIYINSSFYEYQRTRDKLEDIANEKERVFLSFGPEVLVSVKNTTYDIEQQVKEKNATADLMNEEQIYCGYSKGLQLGLDLLFPSLTLAFSGLKLLWKTYIKDTYIGKKLVDVKAKMGNAVTSSKSSFGQKLALKLKKSKVMNTKFGLGLQKIGTKLQKGLSKAAKVFSSIAKRITPVVGLLTSALGLWSLINQFTDCKDKEKQSEESVKKMRTFVTNTTEILNSVTAANAEIQEAFDNITNYVFDEAIVEAMTALKTMMLDENIAKKTDVTTEVETALQAYIDGKDLSRTSEENKQRINEIQRNANAALHRIPFTLDCYTQRGKFITGVKSECKNGEKSLAQTYDNVKRLQSLDSAISKCKEKTPGDLLPTKEAVKNMWKKWAETNDLKEQCLMNNDRVVENVIKELQDGNTDATEIAKAIDKVGAEDEIEAMIQLLRNDPRVNQLPDNIQRLICSFRGILPDEQALGFVNKNSPNRVVTMEEFKNQVCPPPTST